MASSFWSSSKTISHGEYAGTGWHGVCAAAAMANVQRTHEARKSMLPVYG
jgi:hypothetical protein